MLFKVVMRMIMSNNLAGDEDDLVEDTRRSIPKKKMIWLKIQGDQYLIGGRWEGSSSGRRAGNGALALVNIEISS